MFRNNKEAKTTVRPNIGWAWHIFLFSFFTACAGEFWKPLQMDIGDNNSGTVEFSISSDAAYRNDPVCATWESV